MAKILCFENTEFDFPIRLFQTGKNKFTVEYGEQVTYDLTYEQAATELGQCLLHALACRSIIKSS